MPVLYHTLQFEPINLVQQALHVGAVIGFIASIFAHKEDKIKVVSLENVGLLHMNPHHLLYVVDDLLLESLSNDRNKDQRETSGIPRTDNVPNMMRRLIRHCT